MTSEVFYRLEDILGDIPRRGVIHVGAHIGQEVEDYRRAGFSRIVLIEPSPYELAQIKPATDVILHQCACGSTPGWREFYVTSWTERASLLRPIEYSIRETYKVQVMPLRYLQNGCNVAVIDVQGAELDVIQSADLPSLDAIVVEVSDDERYEGAASKTDIATFFGQANWVKRGSYGGSHSAGIADELWTPAP